MTGMLHRCWIVIFTIRTISTTKLINNGSVILMEDPQVRIIEGSERETVFFEHLISSDDSEKFQSLSTDGSREGLANIHVADGRTLLLMRPLLHLQIFTGFAEDLQPLLTAKPPPIIHNNHVAVEEIDEIVTPEPFVTEQPEEPTKPTDTSKDFWNFLFGSSEPKKLADYLLGRVSFDKIAASSKSSPKLLSPSLLSVEPENSEKSGRLLLSPTLLSLHNRSDSLINIPEVLRDSPEIYGLVKAVVEEVMANRNREMAENQARISKAKGTKELNHRDETEQIRSKGKISWLRFDPVNITDDDILVVEDFHKKWKSNATLRHEWRHWYKENRNLTDAELNKLMRLNSSASSFDQILHDAVINMPFILTPENASSPGILSPVIASPYILSPYIFGPFILSPLVLTPQILSPSLLSPSIINPYVLSPLILSPGVLNPSILSPYVLSPSILSPQVLGPNILSPAVLSPCILSPKVLSPDVLNPLALSPAVLCPSVLSDAYLSPGVLSDTYCPGC